MRHTREQHAEIARELTSDQGERLLRLVDDELLCTDAEDLIRLDFGWKMKSRRLACATAHGVAVARHLPRGAR